MAQTYTPFNQKAIDAIVKDHIGTLKRIHEIEKTLRGTFYRMEIPIRSLILAVLTGESLLLVGPPGTAKSSLIREFCRLIGIEMRDEDDHDYFEYLLTQFTEPSELLGYYDIKKAQEAGELRRKRDGMIQDARIVYLDEVFNASSAILNTLLAMINERFYHERGEVIDTQLDVLFGATNQLPDSDDLRALYDRFLLRAYVGNIDTRVPDDVTKMLQMAWCATYNDQRQTNHPGRNAKSKAETTGNKAKNVKKEDTLELLRQFRFDIDRQKDGMLTRSAPDFYNKLSAYVNQLRRYYLSQMSNRRLVKFMHLMLMNMIYRQAITGDYSTQITESDFGLLRMIVDQPNLSAVHEDKLPQLDTLP